MSDRDTASSLVKIAMRDINTQLTRQGLLELVWTMPATHIAKEFGVKLAVVLRHATY